MAMTKDEMRRAFRTAMAADYADVPAKEDLDHAFSPAFCTKTDALLAGQKRGSRRLPSRRARRTLVAAAILVLSVLLISCSDTSRDPVSGLVVSIHETFADFALFQNANEPSKEIDTLFVFDPVPDGFTLFLQEKGNPYNAVTEYRSSAGGRLILHQSSPGVGFSSTDNEHMEVFSKTVAGTNVWFAIAEDLQVSDFFYNDYHFHLNHIGTMTQEEFEALVENFLTNAVTTPTP